MKLEKQITRRGCTSFFIMVDGECKGTVQKCSDYHHGYRAQQTWYTAWMGEKISFNPDVYWGDIFGQGKGVLFKQALTDDGMSFAENGHKVRKRMIDWIKQYLDKEEQDCWAEFDQRMKPVTE
tara:strand:- start:1608 stop:1976 length:369 start_codon:yes stop_codon:yes gene_type:complete